MTKICSINDCSKPTVGRGWCKFHYNRWCRFGDPLASPKKTPDGVALKFLLDAVEYAGDDCLAFPFRTVGYGVIAYEGRNWVPSRLVCFLVNGPPPSDNHESSHSCGNGHLRCISPKHLRWKTPAENQAERVEHGTSNRGSQHGMSHLSEQDVLDIFRRCKTTEPQPSIARRYQISQVAVSNIKLGKTWGWLTGVSP